MGIHFLSNDPALSGVCRFWDGPCSLGLPASWLKKPKGQANFSGLTCNRSKAGKARHVPLSNGVMHLRSTMPRDSQWVFPNPDASKPFVSVYCAWQTARTKAGLADAASNAATLAVGSVMGAMPNQVLDVPLVAA